MYILDEDGEADSFLGQTDPPDLSAPPPPANQSATASTFSYFQQSPTPAQSDPFAGISSSQHQQPFSSPAPLGPAPIPTFIPSQTVAAPPTLQPGPAPPQLDIQPSQPQQPRTVHFQEEPSAGTEDFKFVFSAMNHSVHTSTNVFTM